MVGQKYMLQWLREIAPTHKLEGWQTSIIRKQLGLPKNKDKSSRESNGSRQLRHCCGSEPLHEVQAFL